jgi:hypothetical protein
MRAVGGSVVERGRNDDRERTPSAAPYLDLTTATVLRSQFAAKRDVLDEIADDQWWPVAWMDSPLSSYPPHFHVGAESLYLLHGELEFTDIAAGTTHVLGPLDKLIIPARVTHSVASTRGATYIIGLSKLGPFEGHFIPADDQSTSL